MPLTKMQKVIKGNFIKEYGKKRGTQIFYAWENKYFGSKGKRNIYKGV